MRIVLDTNTLVSAALIKKSISRDAFDKALQIGQLLASEKTLNELADVLAREKFDKYVSLKERQEFYVSYLEIVNMKDIVEVITDCRDSKDNKFLEIAVSGKANIIVSGDADLLVLHPYRNIEILTPRQFLEWQPKP
ncbi:putative toxin-antitoxin system toxin component, PIN family [Runella aurantiaca]|uniref:Putative toxin-antitoxin system toxin component, PIN family n=1 Tax=Runella aurantiaca TaxID=2282308 RepID=A0A369I9H3_9BACT|nr:putative toxin-antitoxin system toxin component, PIN family [Runella aurantiaca]